MHDSLDQEPGQVDYKLSARQLPKCCFKLVIVPAAKSPCQHWCSCYHGLQGHFDRLLVCIHSLHSQCRHCWLQGAQLPLISSSMIALFSMICIRGCAAFCYRQPCSYCLAICQDCQHWPAKQMQSVDAMSCPGAVFSQLLQI